MASALVEKTFKIDVCRTPVPTCLWTLAVSSPTCLWKRGSAGPFFGASATKKWTIVDWKKLTCQNLRQHAVNTNLRPKFFLHEARRCMCRFTHKNVTAMQAQGSGAAAAPFLHRSRRCVCRGLTSHLRLVKETDTNQAAKPEPKQTTSNNKPNPKKEQGSFLRLAASASGEE